MLKTIIELFVFMFMLSLVLTLVHTNLLKQKDRREKVGKDKHYISKLK